MSRAFRVAFASPDTAGDTTVATVAVSAAHAPRCEQMRAATTGAGSAVWLE